jgi:hypothetical protein
MRADDTEYSRAARNAGERRNAACGGMRGPAAHNAGE